MGRREVRVEFWFRNLKESNRLEELTIDGMILLKRALRK
jgi:hypothetical protein